MNPNDRISPPQAPAYRGHCMTGRPQKGTPVQEDGTKVCSKCLEQKPADSFNASAGARDGLDPQCKDCKKEQYLARKVNPKRKRKNVTRRNVKKKLRPAS